MLAVAALVALQRTNDLDKVVRAAIGDRPIAGVVVAASYKGHVFTQAIGSSNLESAKPMSPDSRFHIDSITKRLTAYAILRLVHQHKLKLDNDIATYLPKFAGRNIRIRNLLNHTSGLTNYNDLPEFDESKSYSHEQLEDQIAKSKTLFRPGESWSYSNSAYFLLGLIIEKAAGIPYESFMNQSVFRPLHMNDTGFDQTENTARGHMPEQSKFVVSQPIEWKSVYSAGAVISTAQDLLKFERSIQSTKNLSKTEISLMQSATKIDGVAIPYGFGTRLGNLAGHQFFGHTGSGAGYYNCVESYPSDHLVIAVLTNSQMGIRPQSIAASIARHFLHIPTRPNKQVPLDPTVAKLTFGTYRTEDGNVDLVVKGNQLVATLPDPKHTEIPVSYLGHSTFTRFPGDEIRVIKRKGIASWLIEATDGMFTSASPRIR